MNTVLKMISRMKKMMMSMKRRRMMTRTTIISGCVMRRVPWMHPPPSSGRYQLQTDSLYFSKDEVAAYSVYDHTGLVKSKIKISQILS